MDYKRYSTAADLYPTEQLFSRAQKNIAPLKEVFLMGWQ